MKKNIYLLLCLLGFSLLLNSCNHKSERLYHILPIEKEYAPVEHIFDRGEISKEELQEMPNLRIIINSEDEFPTENLIGLKELKESNIDFRKYTLLVGYFKLPGIVLGHKYSYAENLETGNLIFKMGYILDRDLSENPETWNLFTYSGSAILVSKIPQDYEVEFVWSY